MKTLTVVMIALQLSCNAFDATETAGAINTIQGNITELETALQTIQELQGALDSANTIISQHEARIAELEATAVEPITKEEAWQFLTDHYRQKESDHREEAGAWMFGLIQAATQGAADLNGAVITDGNGAATLLHAIMFRVGEYLSMDAYVPEYLKPLGRVILEYYPDLRP